MLLLAQDEEGDGGSMTDEQLRDEAMTLFVAGHETTANALTWTWYLLSQHPEVEATLHEAIEGRQPLTNLYAYAPARLPSEEVIRQAIEEAVQAEPSPYDSHPSPKDRFTWVHALPVSAHREAPDDEQDAWVVFGDRIKLEEGMTAEVRTNVEANHGVRIPAA